MSQSTVSVVIPTKDRADSLLVALESALKQEPAPLEVIVVDDGSEGDLGQSPLLVDTRVKLVRRDHPGGPAVARQLGVSVSEGDYVAFLDDDDYWLPGKLRACLSCLADHPEAGAVFHSSRWSADGLDVSCHVLREPLDRMLLEQPPSLSGVVVNRALHDDVGFDSRFPGAEDLDYLIRLAEVIPMVEIPGTFTVIGKTTRSEIGMEQRIEGRLRLREKHQELFEDRRRLAFWYMRLGHLYRQGGKRLKSITSFARSVSLRPNQRKAWKGLALAMLPEIVADRLIEFRRAGPS